MTHFTLLPAWLIRLFGKSNINYTTAQIADAYIWQYHCIAGCKTIADTSDCAAMLCDFKAKYDADKLGHELWLHLNKQLNNMDKEITAAITKDVRETGKYILPTKK